MCQTETCDTCYTLYNVWNVLTYLHTLKGSQIENSSTSNITVWVSRLGMFKNSFPGSNYSVYYFHDQCFVTTREGPRALFKVVYCPCSFRIYWFTGWCLLYDKLFSTFSALYICVWVLLMIFCLLFVFLPLLLPC